MNKIEIAQLFFHSLEMEIKSEGRNFRMVSDDELPKILETLEKYLPYSMKVSTLMHFE